MTTVAVERRVDSLEEYMRELSYQSMRTEMELARLSKEMREFKDECGNSRTRIASKIGR